MKKAWVEFFEVANDGEVTALAIHGTGTNGVLGIAMGTSMAGAVSIAKETSPPGLMNWRLFVDYNLQAPVDEWSGDLGWRAHFSAKCPAVAAAGISGFGAFAASKRVQGLMAAGDDRARRIYQTIGTYLGYAILHYAEFYDFGHVLVLGRVISGSGGDVIVAGAKEVLQSEAPEVSSRIIFHLPDEKEKRHGQAIAAASLPAIE